jgi:hypothetical protein
MARDPTTVAELIALWGSAERFAREVGLKRPEHARTMRARGSINERWWDAVVLAASRGGIERVNHRVLAQINARNAERGRGQQTPFTAGTQGAAA